MSRAAGRVVAFDPDEGLGVIELDDGRRIGLHATQLADGTRHVELGARVTCTVVPWHRGELEATDVATGAAPAG